MHPAIPIILTIGTAAVYVISKLSQGKPVNLKTPFIDISIEPNTNAPEKEKQPKPPQVKSF